MIPETGGGLRIRDTKWRSRLDIEQPEADLLRVWGPGGDRSGPDHDSIKSRALHLRHFFWVVWGGTVVNRSTPQYDFVKP